MSFTGSDRQYSYRLRHPQLNVTFRDFEEHRTVKQACLSTGRTPREILVIWARNVLAKSQPSAGKPNVDNSSGNNPASGN